ncbi:hypothetical protein AB1L88_22100 [Tautonia sp. JC769]|uniref:hypothetical protein n=1 Tax=Tautonia sp. JC769 TaxID=3232135 RepID=UPI0034574DE9
MTNPLVRRAWPPFMVGVAIGVLWWFAFATADEAIGIIRGGLRGRDVDMAVLGYCPGTGVAACGEGRRDAMVGVLGMLFGAGVFVAVAPALGPLIEGFGDRGEVTIPGLLGISPWAGVGVLVLLGGTGLVVRRRLEGKRREGGLVARKEQVVSARGGTSRP